MWPFEVTVKLGLRPSLNLTSLKKCDATTQAETCGHKDERLTSFSRCSEKTK